MTQEKIDFGIFELNIDNQDKGGTYYKEPKFWADLISPLSRSIIKICKPTIFLDIGANYGFTSLIQCKNNPNCTIIAVEASPKLIPFLKENLQNKGWEEKVFKGGQSWLQNNSNWIIKTEFAPDWLRSQNTDPVNLLKYLARNYLIAEVPNRSRFKGDNLKRIIRQSLKPRECAAFVDYIQALAKRNGVGIGWCDLIVLPYSTAEKILNQKTKNS